MPDATQPRPCPVCGSTDQSRLFAQARLDPAQLDQYAFASRKLPEYMHHRLLECPSCAVLYASPVPDLTALHDAYRDAGFDSSEEAQAASRTYIKLVHRHLRLPDRAGALDIGTGEGAFLQRLQDAGFTDIVGVEPSTAPIQAAHPSVRPLIHQGLFGPDSFPPDHFRLITCFQTIEHVPDPLTLCRAAHRMLKPGGALILVGHNRQSLSARLLGRKSPIFDLEHLQLFSLPSITRLLHEAGFADVTARPIVNRYPLHYWLKLFPFPRRIKLALIRFTKLAQFGYLPLPLPAGNLVAWGYRR